MHFSLSNTHVARVFRGLHGTSGSRLPLLNKTPRYGNDDNYPESIMTRVFLAKCCKTRSLLAPSTNDFERKGCDHGGFSPVLIL
jgi:hypothetical protein